MKTFRCGDEDIARISVMPIFKRARPVKPLLCFDGPVLSPVEGLTTNGEHVNMLNAYTVRPERVEG